MMCSYDSNCLESVIGNYSSGSGIPAAMYSGGSSGPSLDYMIAAETIQAPLQHQPIYDFDSIKKEVYADTYRPTKRLSQSYSHCIDDFLNPQRPLTAFIGKASEIQDLAEDTFQKLTGRVFPDDVVIRIVSSEEMKKMHPANVQGFALNRKHMGLVSEVFIKEDLLDKVMLTLGHELGHVLTRRLDNNKDEEAKAFAFSIAWMKTIKENNIGNLAMSIQLDKPADNGLHNIALDYVLDSLNQGKQAINIWQDLVKGFARVGDKDVSIWS